MTGNLKPVRIGFIGGWSGINAANGVFVDEAVEVINTYVEEIGGVLGGRRVEIIKVDGRTDPDHASACFRQLAADGSAAIGGGVSPDEILALTDIAEECRTLYLSMGQYPEDLCDLPFSVRVNPRSKVNEILVRFAVDELKTERVAILAHINKAAPIGADYFVRVLQQEGVEILLREDIPIGTRDFRSCLKKIKDAEPDLLITDLVDIYWYDMFAQIEQIGGWGEIRCLCSQHPLKLPLADGIYHAANWIPGSAHPGTRKMEQLFKRHYNRLPARANLLTYLSLRTALAAIELAGTDEPAAVGRAARSGQLIWEGPQGPFRIDRDGENNLANIVAVARNGRVYVVPTR